MTPSIPSGALFDGLRILTTFWDSWPLSLGFAGRSRSVDELAITDPWSLEIGSHEEKRARERRLAFVSIISFFYICKGDVAMCGGRYLGYRTLLDVFGDSTISGGVRSIASSSRGPGYGLRRAVWIIIAWS